MDAHKTQCFGQDETSLTPFIRFDESIGTFRGGGVGFLPHSIAENVFKVIFGDQLLYIVFIFLQYKYKCCCCWIMKSCKIEPPQHYGCWHLIFKTSILICSSPFPQMYAYILNIMIFRERFSVKTRKQFSFTFVIRRSVVDRKNWLLATHQRALLPIQWQGQDRLPLDRFLLQLWLKWKQISRAMWSPTLVSGSEESRQNDRDRYCLNVFVSPYHLVSDTSD